jgi:hypothetical protein
MDQKTVWWMVLLGIVRHVLSIIGAWLVSRGLIDGDTHDRLMSEGAVQVAGWTLMALPLVWSVAQKLQAVRWIREALRIESRQALIADVPASAGAKVTL